MLSDPESLCARVLRAKYYPDGKLLQARMKSGSSFTWQSVLAGLECFKRGYIWRVGDGSQINIWNDNWIPGSHNMKVLTPRGNVLVSTVDELINPIDGRWAVQLIRSIYFSLLMLKEFSKSPSLMDVRMWWPGITTGMAYSR